MTIETTEKEYLLNSRVAREGQEKIVKHSEFEMENPSCPENKTNTEQMQNLTA